MKTIVVFLLAILSILAVSARPAPDDDDDNVEGVVEMPEFQFVNPAEDPAEVIEQDETVVDDQRDEDVPVRRNRRNHGCPLSGDECRHHCGGYGHCGGFLNFKCLCGGHMDSFNSDGGGGHHGGGGGHHGGGGDYEHRRRDR